MAKTGKGPVSREKKNAKNFLQSTSHTQQMSTARILAIIVPVLIVVVLLFRIQQRSSQSVGIEPEVGDDANPESSGSSHRHHRGPNHVRIKCRESTEAEAEAEASGATAAAAAAAGATAAGATAAAAAAAAASSSSSVAAAAKSFRSELGFDITKCRGLYFDLGTNIGRQIHKLYEPTRFPNALALPFFDRHFGAANSASTPRSDICAIGFEPNTAHTPWLVETERRLRCNGYKVRIFTETAVTTSDENLTFYRDVRANEVNQEWGASLLKYGQTSGGNTKITKTETTVRGMDLAAFIKREIAEPLKAANITNMPVLTKLDVEGVEYKLLVHLLMNGAFCEMGTLMVEWHTNYIPEDVTKYNLDWPRLAAFCTKPTKFVDLDDETYGYDKDIAPKPCPGDGPESTAEMLKLLNKFR